MKKNLIALAVAATMASPLVAQAADSANVSGFGDIYYDTSSKAFGADGEIDAQKTVGSVTARIDVDFGLATGAGGSSASLEQVFFAWGATDAITVIGGVFNNPIGEEAQDAPDFFFTSHSVVYNILNNQTALYANNVAGVAAAGSFGPVTLTGAVLNDIGGTAEENSYAIVANASPMKGLDLEFGFVTQQDAAATGGAQAGNVWDINGKYSIGQFSIVADVLGAADIIDLAYNVWGSYDINDKLSVRLRYESVSYNNADANSKITGYVGYAIEDNLYVALESSKGSVDVAGVGGVDGIVDDSVTSLEFIATF